MLANEIYSKMNGQYGTPCNLLTGQQRVEVPGAMHTACTIEMCPIEDDAFFLSDVGVVDEFQMIGCQQRGWAWFRAILGLPVSELHLCGNGAALELVQKLCQSVGDAVEVVDYQRLSPLNAEPQACSLRSLQPGDAVIAFSRRKIYEYKAEIEHTTHYRCSVVYGSLPPEARTQQAQLFNDPRSNYDIIVASDAIGMGLNLNCRRVVFTETTKYDGTARRRLLPDEIKQIAGRAGRYGSQYPEGFVTALSPRDLRFLKGQLQKPWSAVARAGTLPEYTHIARFLADNPGLQFSRAIEELVAQCKLQGLFFFCDTEELLEVAGLLQTLAWSDLKDLYTFCMAPVKLDNRYVMGTFFSFGQKFVMGRAIRADFLIPDLPTIEGLETLYAVLDLYLWLAAHFPKRFTEQDSAKRLSLDACQQLTALLKQQTSSRKKAQQRGGSSPAYRQNHHQRRHRVPDITVLRSIEVDSHDQDLLKRRSFRKQHARRDKLDRLKEARRAKRPNNGHAKRHPRSSFDDDALFLV